MQVVGDISILVHQRHGLLVDNKLISESVALRCLVVGIGQVADGHTLRTVLLANPVGIRQIDADGGSRIFLTAKHRRTDYIGCNALHLRLAEAGIHRRMVLKPLRILADGLRALGGLQVLVFHDSLPGTFQSQRVAIYLDESVDEIHHALVLLHPGDAISVEIHEITCAIELHEQVDNVLLSLILGIFLSLEQPGYDFPDGLTIKTIFLPNQFHHLAVALGELGIETIRWRSSVVGVLHLGIEPLHFLLGHILIEVAGRSLHQVLAIRLVHALRHHLGVEDHGYQQSEQVFLALSTLQRQFRLVDVLHQFIEEFLRESRLEFLAAIMMMDAAGEPYSLQINLESLEFLAFADISLLWLSAFADVRCQRLCLLSCSLIVAIDCLQGLADAQVVLSLLIERDVTSHQRCH